MFETHTYYFGKIPEEFQQDCTSIAGWEPNYYFRFRIDEANLSVRLEDTCNRVVPLDFSSLYELHTTLTRLIVELQAQLVGAPLK